MIALVLIGGGIIVFYSGVFCGAWWTHQSYQQPLPESNDLLPATPPNANKNVVSLYPNKKGAKDDSQSPYSTTTNPL